MALAVARPPTLRAVQAMLRPTALPAAQQGFGASGTGGWLGAAVATTSPSGVVAAAARGPAAFGCSATRHCHSAAVSRCADGDSGDARAGGICSSFSAATHDEAAVLAAELAALRRQLAALGVQPAGARAMVDRCV